MSPGEGTISVLASPANATVISGKTKQYVATVSNSPNTAVTWSATAGSIDASGLFTAPVVASATQIRVTATSRADSSKGATVSLTVQSAPSVATLAVSPSSLKFAAQIDGSSPAPASVSITSDGDGMLSFTGNSDQPWLVLSTGSGTAPSTLQVGLSISGLKAGTYVGHVTLTSGESTKTIRVTLTMTPAPVNYAVSLSWKAATSNQVTSYSMYRSTIEGGSYELLASALGVANYRDQSVQSETTYYYVVTAVDNAGRESAYSNEIRIPVP